MKPFAGLAMPRYQLTPGTFWQSRCSQKDGSVAVMAAGMSYTGFSRSIGNIFLVFHRKGIHVRSQGNGLSSTLCVKRCDYAGSSDTSPNLEPQILEIVSDDPGGPNLFHPKLGIPMQIPSDLLHLI